MIPALRHYQTHVMRENYAAWSRGVRRVLDVLDTGTGKTHIIGQTAHDAVVKRARRAIVLAHRKELITQAYEKLRLFEVPTGMMLDGKAYDANQPCQVASIKTLRSLCMPPADLIIVDEAHRSDAAPVLALYPEAKILGVTATPIFYRNSERMSLFGRYDVMVRCPATRQELRDAGFLVRFRVVGVNLPDLAGVPLHAGDYRQGALSEVMSHPVLIGDAVKWWQSHAHDRPTIAFAVDLAHADKLLTAYRAAGIPTELLSGDVDKDTRAGHLRALARFELKVAISRDVLTEGVDVPPVSCIQMLRPTRSEVVFNQQVGRGVRPHPSKTDCLVLDHAGNVAFHGDPNQDRVWPFSPNPEPRKRDDLPEVPMWRCMTCFSMIQGNRVRVCPECGAEGSAKVKRIGIKDGVLIEYDEEVMNRINEERKAKEAARVLEKRQNGERFKKLYAIAMRKGLNRNSALPWIIKQVAIARNSKVDFEHFLKHL